MNNIFVRATNWIGDAVMSIACLKELRRLYPHAHISVAARPWVADLYSCSDFVDEVMVYDKRGAQRGWNRIAWARNLRSRGFDLAVLLQNAFEAAALARWAGIPRRVGYNTECRGWLLTDSVVPRVRQRPHQLYYYLDLLTLAQLSPRDYQADPEFVPDMRLQLRDSLRRRAFEILEGAGGGSEEPLVGFCPGASFGSAKRWFAHRFVELADQLVQRCGAQIVLLGSASEASLAEQIASQMRPSPLLLTGRTTLPELLALLERCRLVVTNDSGPMHLAASLEVPLVALFGSTDPAATGPVSARARVVRVPVECSPCLLRECPIDLRCFDRIEVDLVFRECQAILEARASESRETLKADT